ncbi:MAG: hypothetical protein QHH09_00995 [Microgenomates group bacterium]|nr:hypothetical protein [Microgenomates group bacterium]
MDQLSEVIIISSIGITISLINILHVIIGAARTPAGFIYQATGHYYLDYFLYLQAINQGTQGHILPIEYFNTSEKSFLIIFTPYSFIGFIGRFFGLSPITIYWLSLFLFVVIFIILIYFFLKKMFEKQNWFYPLWALTVFITASPFYKISFYKNNLDLQAYDFWYGPSIFTRRFETVPYHILSSILILLVIFITVNLWRSFFYHQSKDLLLKIFLSLSLIFILVFFSPFNVLTLLLTIVLGTVFYFSKFILKSEKEKAKNYFLYGFFVTAGTLLFLILVNQIYNNVDLFKRVKNLEVNWQEHVSLSFLLLNIGPMVIFFPFGLPKYFKNLNPAKLFMAILTLISYCLFLSPVAFYLGTHNLRFFSPLNYIFFSVLTVYGVEKFTKLVRLRKKIFFNFILIILIGYGVFYNGFTLFKRVLNLDPKTPITSISYLSKDIINGLIFLKNKENKAVLTGPSHFIGMVVPLYADKKVYLGREIETPDFAKKQLVVDKFFRGEIDETEILTIIKKNDIGYVVLTSLDGFSPNNLKNYSFLKKIYDNGEIIIWEIVY